MLINKTMKTLLALIFIFFSASVHANRINQDQGLIEILEIGYDIVDVVRSGTSGNYILYILQLKGTARTEIVHCEYSIVGEYQSCWQVQRNK